MALVEDAKRPGELIDVCPTCFAGGPEGIRKECLLAAERLADWAKSEAARAQAIQSEEIIMPSPEDRAKAKAEAELRAEWGEPARAHPADNVEALPF